MEGEGVASPEASERVFKCSPGGAVALGKRRIRRLLLGLALLMAGLGVWMFVVGRWGPGLICCGAVALILLSLSMSGDLDPLWLTVSRGRLSVQMRRKSQALELVSVTSRRLAAEELRHLSSLSAASGVIFATASFESHLLGAFDLFATDLDNAVAVEVDAPPEQEEDRICWVVTPDDPAGFLEAVEIAGGAEALE